MIILAIVAVATAWSGYRAAKWDGRQALLYRFEADAASTIGEQRLAADASLLNGWLQARSVGDSELEALFVRRFSPEYRTAFHAWLRTDPFNDPTAPARPRYMLQYRNPSIEQAKQLNDQASEAFDGAPPPGRPRTGTCG